jgi:hypothetical protein
MNRSPRRPRTVLAGALFALVALSGVARAQLNFGYTEGYKPLQDLRSPLEGMLGDENKRGDYAAVRELATKYHNCLSQLIGGVGNIGRSLKDSDNSSWAAAARNEVLGAADRARQAVELLKSYAENQKGCLGPLQSLQGKLKELDDKFKDCWQQHERRRRELDDGYNVIRQRWWDMTKEDRRPLDEQARRVDALRTKFRELQKVSEAALSGYYQALAVSERALKDLNEMSVDRSPDEYERRYGEWKKAEELTRNLNTVAREREQVAEAADREYDDAYRELNRAMEQYVKEVAESDEVYKLVLDRHRKRFEFYQEYKPFSL